MKHSSPVHPTHDVDKFGDVMSSRGDRKRSELLRTKEGRLGVSGIKRVRSKRCSSPDGSKKGSRRWEPDPERSLKGEDGWSGIGSEGCSSEVQSRQKSNSQRLLSSWKAQKSFTTPGCPPRALSLPFATSFALSSATTSAAPADPAVPCPDLGFVGEARTVWLLNEVGIDDFGISVVVD